MQQLLMGEPQSYFSSFGVGRSDRNEVKGHRMQHQPRGLAIRNPYPHAALFLLPRNVPLRSACNGWYNLPSLPTVPRGSKRLLRERKSMLCCRLPFGERKHLNDMIVAITATFSWLINRPTPSLIYPENVFQNFLFHTSIAATRASKTSSEIPQDPVSYRSTVC